MTEQSSLEGSRDEIMQSQQSSLKTETRKRSSYRVDDARMQLGQQSLYTEQHLLTQLLRPKQHFLPIYTSHANKQPNNYLYI